MGEAQEAETHGPQLLSVEYPASEATVCQKPGRTETSERASRVGGCLCFQGKVQEAQSGLRMIWRSSYSND